MKGPKMHNALCQLLVVLVLAALGGAIVHQRAFRDLDGCKEILKKIATATEMYGADEVGVYPKNLGQLPPPCLKSLPLCPSVGMDTYSSGFTSQSSPDAFSICCVGHNHALLGIPPNYPQYFNTTGLVER